jgi:hypothetical protein
MVIACGLIVGPSLGHFYAAHPGRALLGIGVRTLASVGIAAAGAEALGEGGGDSLEALGYVGFAVGAASLIWDIATAPHSAHAHNDQVRHGQMTISPSFGPAGLGLRAAVSF